MILQAFSTQRSATTGVASGADLPVCFGRGTQRRPGGPPHSFQRLEFELHRFAADDVAEVVLPEAAVAGETVDQELEA